MNDGMGVGLRLKLRLKLRLNHHRRSIDQYIYFSFSVCNVLINFGDTYFTIYVQIEKSTLTGSLAECLSRLERVPHVDLNSHFS